MEKKLSILLLIPALLLLLTGCTALDDTEMKSTTKLNIDGKRVFIYRCDYSIYDLDTVAQMK